MWLRLCRLSPTLHLVSEVATFELGGPDRKRVASAVGAPGSRAPIVVRTDAGEVELPAAAEAAVRHLLADLAAGTAVHVVADAGELTTQETADLLGISRTYVVRLIDGGKLPAHLVGTHRRLKAHDVIAYKAQRDARLVGVAAIADADIDAGVPYR